MRNTTRLSRKVRRGLEAVSADVVRVYERIGGRTAIEICAGRSGLGRHLGIPMTDAFTMSEEANHQAKAVVTGAIPTIPGPDVERLEALEAVERYRPQVVIAAWATPYMPGEKVRKGYRGSAFGVREVELVGRCEEYLKIGTLSLNAHNPVRGLPHEEYRLPFVVGRVMKKNEERVWIWKGGRSR